MYRGEHILQSVVSTEAFKHHQVRDFQTLPAMKPCQSAEDLAIALQEGLFSLDDLIKETHIQSTLTTIYHFNSSRLKEGHDRSGSTAIISFVTDKHIIFANCGIIIFGSYLSTFSF